MVMVLLLRRRLSSPSWSVGGVGGCVGIYVVSIDWAWLGRLLGSRWSINQHKNTS